MALIIWSILFILFGRALNIFPLAELSNRFRTHKITKKMMVIMWFSGLRGAIAYALSLHLEFEEDVRKVIVTTTLVVVLFTTICLGKTARHKTFTFKIGDFVCMHKVVMF